MKTENGKYELINILDLGTGYGERAMVKSRSAEEIMYKVEEYWICRHGRPRRFSADPELCQPFSVRYLGGYNIKVNERPANYSHKNGMV